MRTASTSTSISKLLSVSDLKTKIKRAFLLKSYTYFQLVIDFYISKRKRKSISENYTWNCRKDLTSTKRPFFIKNKLIKVLYITAKSKRNRLLFGIQEKYLHFFTVIIIFIDLESALQ